jgi:hypothetical protein
MDKILNYKIIYYMHQIHRHIQHMGNQNTEIFNLFRANLVALTFLQWPPSILLLRLHCNKAMYTLHSHITSGHTLMLLRLHSRKALDTSLSYYFKPNTHVASAALNTALNTSHPTSRLYGLLPLLVQSSVDTKHFTLISL